MGTGAEFFHSTAEGEENSTTQTRTLDVVTKVTSGNNTVKYAYDNKRRAKSVSLNGVEDYVTYNYEETDTGETVTATMANTTITTVKDKQGNIVSVDCNGRTVTKHLSS